MAELRSWPEILVVLEQLLATLKANHVPAVLVKVGKGLAAGGSS